MRWHQRGSGPGPERFLPGKLGLGRRRVLLKPAIAVAFGACPRAQRRSRRPCEGAGGAGQSGGGGGQGAAPEVPGSQPPANSEFLRHELGRASVSTPAHPPLPAWAPPSAGWEALPRPRTPPSALLGDDHTPLSLPGLWPLSGQEGDSLGGPGWGVMPFYRTSLAWIHQQLPFVA